jgi:hypothetical protein
MLLITRPAPFARYYFPLLPLIVLLVSAGILALYKNLVEEARATASSDRRRALAIACAGVLALLPVLGVAPSAVKDAHFRYHERLEGSAGYQDMMAMRELIQAGAGGVIARDSAIQAELPDNQVYTHYLLSEAEYVTFLSWPSDEQAVDVLRRRGISWVILVNDLRWERDYHVWLPATYGIPVRHFARVPASPGFREAYKGRVYSLYELLPSAGPVATEHSP